MTKGPGGSGRTASLSDMHARCWVQFGSPSFGNLDLSVAGADDGGTSPAETLARSTARSQVSWLAQRSRKTKGRNLRLHWWSSEAGTIQRREKGEGREANKNTPGCTWPPPDRTGRASHPTSMSQVDNGDNCVPRTCRMPGQVLWVSVRVSFCVQ
jgi:hypothetical protein